MIYWVEPPSPNETETWEKIYIFCFNFLHLLNSISKLLLQVSSDFDPQSDLYKESLVILGSVPAAWLIATLVVLLIYLCTRCCDSKSTKRRKSRPMR